MHRREVRERVLGGLVRLRPAAGRGQRHDRQSPAAGRELQRDVAAERVADDMGGLEAGLVHRPLDRVGQHGLADFSFDRRPAGVPGQRGGEHVVLTLERGQHELRCARCR